ncbi:MAG: electron transfer flavoprotein subunit beta [Alphaproteobacteria bacterium]|nr:electron transfer flavoprotein subunit beta [Alphaproteobacteria bacterium]
MLSVTVLVSIGRHPGSGRARRAVRDAQAVELALRLPNAIVEVVHAGNPDRSDVRDYLGMGIGWLRVLSLPAGADAVPPLVSWLRARRPDLVLAGTLAEAGEGSGMVPYLVAEALGYPIVAATTACELDQGRARLLQALPRGQRRAYSVALPLVATVDAAAPPARAVAFSEARRGRIEAAAMPSAAAEAALAWERGPARPRPKRLRAATGGSALERLRAATNLTGGGGTTLVHPDAATASAAIWDFLVREGMVAPANRDEGGADGRG